MSLGRIKLHGFGRLVCSAADTLARRRGDDVSVEWSGGTLAASLKYPAVLYGTGRPPRSCWVIHVVGRSVEQMRVLGHGHGESRPVAQAPRGVRRGQPIGGRRGRGGHSTDPRCVAPRTCVGVATTLPPQLRRAAPRTSRDTLTNRHVTKRQSQPPRPIKRSISAR